MDDRADRAMILRLVRRMVRRILLRRGRLGRRHAGNGRGACEAIEMDVSERKHKLQRYRGKRQPTSAPPIGPNPTHQANCPTNPRSMYRRVARAQRHGNQNCLAVAQLGRAVAAV
jgi:hypothetical protein